MCASMPVHNCATHGPCKLIHPSSLHRSIFPFPEVAFCRFYFFIEDGEDTRAFETPPPPPLPHNKPEQADPIV